MSPCTESAYLVLRHTLLDGRVLRSGDRPGVQQGLWALLALYQLLRRAMVECATSRYLNHGDERPHTVTAITAIHVTRRTPPLRDSATGRRPHRRPLIGPPQPTRRQRITAIITSQPPREWSGHDLAILLGVKPRNMLTQLGEWARLGFFTRTGFGTYRLNTPSDQTPLTDPPDP